MAPENDSNDITRSHVQLVHGNIIGHYRIIEKIGAGGMGEVYLAQDTKLDRKVALKFLPLHMCQDAECRARFTREAQAAAKLNHPSIVTIHEVSEFSGRPFFAMENVEGQTLRDFGKGKELPFSRIIELAIQVCEGLAKAHTAGIVHRDIKPSNILIDQDGRAKIVDFGLASVHGSEHLTKTGSTLGTIGYMSPELARGEEADARSDLFSFGVVLYELIAGRSPFKAESEVATIKNIVESVPEPLARYKNDVPDELQHIVSKALAKDKNLRYQHADDLRTDLKRIVGAPKTDLAKRPPSIAVLPFINLSTDKEQEYFCDGMAEEIINALTQVKGLHVVARTSSFAFKDKHDDVREIGRKLNVETLLEGSVRQSGKRLRITAQLVNVSDGFHLWSETYDRTIEDIFFIQDDISLSIAGQLKITLLGKERVAMAGRHSRDVDAYSSYLQGRYFWNKRTEVGFQKGLDHFQRAVERDPTYALAHAGIADCFNLLGFYGVISSMEAFPKAKSAAERALAIDDSLSEALSSLAFATMYHDWRWEEAETEFKRAITLSPGYATCHHWYSEFLLCMGRMDEAMTEANRALEFDPLSLIIRALRALALYFALQYDEAEKQCKNILDLDENFVPAHLFLGMIYTAKSMFDEAIMEFRCAISLFGRSSLMLGALGHAYAISGKQEEANRLFNELVHISEPVCVPSCYIAAMHADLGENDKAFEWLTRAFEEHDAWLVFLRVDPMWQTLRSDPRFIDLLRKMKLE